MAFGNMGNYQADGKTIVIVESGSGERFILCYNGSDHDSAGNGGVTPATRTNGDVVQVSYTNPTPGTASVNAPCLARPVTNSVACRIGVVNNALLNLSTIAVAAWGFVQVAGYCPAITKTTAANPIAVDDYVTAVTVVCTASTDGASGATAISAKSFAIAKSVVATGVSGTFTGFLLDREVTI